MPRVSLTLALLVPLVAIFLVLRSFDDLAAFARVQLASWPFAFHPDDNAQDAAQIHLKQPFSSDSHSHSTSQKQHQDLNVEGKAGGSTDVGEEKGFTRRIVAVGDLHGDLGNALKVLHMANVVDGEGQWSGGVDFFVQTGDIIDRGDDTIKLYAWMDDLREQSLKKGGTVLTNLGNHEWMNVIGDWRYVHQSEIATFGTSEKRMARLMRGRIGKTWAANYTTTSRLPLHPSLGPPNTDYDPTDDSPLSHAAVSFVHGGLAPDYPDLTPFPSRINELGSSLLYKLQHRNPPPAPHPPHPYPGLPSDATPAEQQLYGTNGPLWYRGWALEPEQKVCSAVDDVLQRTGTRRMIMGHTPNFEKIVSRCGGKIIIIDTGISHAYGGVLSALSIEYSLTPISAEEGLSTGNQKLWKEREVVSAVYEDHKEILASSEQELVGEF
ncbi:Metallo-dependent phosphatase-like protein [Irpex rosettiformis]|uniref:Metallo-dependent phosphatase-like protein n=1 Tax=Irpex rosettiformis TaxID=378272 RepID=A0ACB8UA13_9APHY|nr:Metallo-dependent phosphatase-like protein [Irpex rosettiformis]